MPFPTLSPSAVLRNVGVESSNLFFSTIQENAGRFRILVGSPDEPRFSCPAFRRSAVLGSFNQACQPAQLDFPEESAKGPLA